MQDQGGSETHRRKPFGRAGKIGIGCAVFVMWLVPALMAYREGFRQSWPLAVERVVRGEAIDVSEDYFDEKTFGTLNFPSSGKHRGSLRRNWKLWPLSFHPEACGTYRQLDSFPPVTIATMKELARPMLDETASYERVKVMRERRLRDGEFAFEVTLGSPSDYQPTVKSPKARYTILLDGRDCLVAIAKHKLP